MPSPDLAIHHTVDMLLQALQQHAERACVVYMAVIEAQSVMTVNEADVLDWCKQHLEHQWDLREKTEVSQS